MISHNGPRRTLWFAALARKSPFPVLGDGFDVPHPPELSGRNPPQSGADPDLPPSSHRSDQRTASLLCLDIMAKRGGAQRLLPPRRAHFFRNCPCMWCPCGRPAPACVLCHAKPRKPAPIHPPHNDVDPRKVPVRPNIHHKHMIKNTKTAPAIFRGFLAVLGK